MTENRIQQAANEPGSNQQVRDESESFLVGEYLQKIPSLIARGMTYIVLLLVVISIVYSYYSKIDIIVEGRSVSTPTTDKVKVTSDRSGYLEQIYIKPGIKVMKGEALFFIKSKENVSYETKLKSLKSSLFLEEKSFDAQKQSLRDELSELERNHSGTITINRLKLEENKINLESIKADKMYWEKEVGNLDEEFENTRKLYEKRLTSIDDYNNLKSRLERARTEVKKCINQTSSIHTQNDILNAEIARECGAYETRSTVIGDKIHTLEIEKSKSIKKIRDEIEANEKLLTIKHGSDRFRENGSEKGNIVRAQRQGIISELLFKNKGDYVREGDTLCTLVPGDSPLHTDIEVLNKDIGFIEKGMEIKYKFDAFPYIDYGTLNGKVSFIPPSAVEDREKQFIYHINGTLDKNYYDIKGKVYHVKPGMTAKACIVTKKKSIMAMLLGKLKLIKD